MKLRIVFVIFFIIISQTSIKAQNSSEIQIWENYSMRFFNKKYRFWIRNDIGLRQALVQNPQSEYLINPQLMFNIGSVIEFIPGVQFQYIHDPAYLNSAEIRTWQGVRLHWPNIGRVMFEHYYRFEQRFFFLEGKSDGDLGLRSRYRLDARVPINNKMITENTFYIDLRSELYFPHDKEVVELYADNIRAGFNVGYNQNAKWRYHFTFLIDHTKSNINDSRTKDNYIFSLTLRNMF